MVVAVVVALVVAAMVAGAVRTQNDSNVCDVDVVYSSVCDNGDGMVLVGHKRNIQTSTFKKVSGLCTMSRRAGSWSNTPQL